MVTIPNRSSSLSKMHFRSHNNKKTANSHTLRSTRRVENKSKELSRPPETMQASPGFPRPAQRRSPGTDSGPPPPSSQPMPGDGMPTTPGGPSAPRSSSGSGRSQTSRAASVSFHIPYLLFPVKSERKLGV